MPCGGSLEPAQVLRDDDSAGWYIPIASIARARCRRNRRLSERIPTAAARRRDATGNVWTNAEREIRVPADRVFNDLESRSDIVIGNSADCVVTYMDLAGTTHVSCAIAGGAAFGHVKAALSQGNRRATFIAGEGRRADICAAHQHGKVTRHRRAAAVVDHMLDDRQLRLDVFVGDGAGLGLVEVEGTRAAVFRLLFIAVI